MSTEPVAAAKLRLGLAFAALASLCYGSIPSFVRLAYASGADALGVMCMRSLFTALWVAAMAKVMGKPLLPPRDLRWTGVTLGFIWMAGAWSYVVSFGRIPIGLAVTIFYLFPLIVALLTKLWDREPIALYRVLSLALGFLGIALAVGASYDRIDALGVGLAFVSALSVSSNMMVGQRMMRRTNPQAVLLMMTGTATVGFFVMALAIGCRFPTTPTGWFGLATATMLFCGAISFFYSAINMLGPLRTAMMCNLEPVVAVIVAYLILGEAQGPVQILGIAIVIGAIAWMQVGDRRARSSA